ncbi:MAG: hypothetical protein WCI71_07050, partial [Bacteroidota bacterium]
AKKHDMTVTTLDLYNILRSKIGEAEAKTLVEFIEQKVTNQIENEVSGLASKADLKSEIAKLDVKIEKTKSEIIKWMFIFWAGQTGIMVGILALFLK